MGDTTGTLSSGRLPAACHAPGNRGGVAAEDPHADGLDRTPQGFDWDFGDGARVESSGPGVAWPELNGAVTHKYRVKSKAAGFPTGAVNSGQGGYPVSLTVVFDVVWRLNGGAWRAGLAPIQRAITANYPVYEVRGEEVPNFAAG